MNKHIIYLLLLLSATTASAQKDAQAKAILDQVSQKYRSFNFIKSDFTFTIDDQQASIKQTRTGTLVAQSKTSKFKLTIYGEGAAKQQIESEIISDGKTQWTYAQKDKEVEINEASHGTDSFNPAQLFTLYTHGYKYLYTGEQKINSTIYQVIDLTPEEEKSFFKIRLMIDKAKKQIFSALIFDKNGSKYSYTLRSFITNLQLPESTFIYDAKAHPGVETVDLR
jgi:outer membrane lipoprotein-sorting protein